MGSNCRHSVHTKANCLAGALVPRPQGHRLPQALRLLVCVPSGEASPSTLPRGLWDFQKLESQPRGGGRPRSQQGVGVTGKEEGEGTGSCQESRVDCTSGKELGGSRRNGGMAQLGSQEDVSQTLVRTDVRP